MITVGALRKMGITLVIILISYIAFHLTASWLNKRHWDGVCINMLLKLHRSWTADGKPDRYDVTRYHQSPSIIIRLYADTNRYTLDGQTTEAIFAAEYSWGKKPVVFFVTRDGLIFERPEKELRRP
jgi:hypothetical protein